MTSREEVIMAENKVSLNELSQFFWRSWADGFLELRTSNEHRFMYGIAQHIDRCYPDPNDPKLSGAQKNYKSHGILALHLEQCFVLGLAASMEEAYAERS